MKNKKEGDTLEGMEIQTSDFIKVISKVKSLAIVVVIMAFLFSGTICVLYVRLVSNKEKEIYVVHDAGTFMAKRNDYGIRYDFEIKNHIRSFLQMFYENDQHTFSKNIDASLNLIDKNDGRRIYKGFNEKAYDFYVQNNAYSKVIIDSLRVNADVRPYTAKVWFKIILYYAGNSKPMYNAASMRISENVRSEKNPFGLMLQDFQFIEYKVSAAKAAAINDSLAKDIKQQQIKEETK